MPADASGSMPVTKAEVLGQAILTDGVAFSSENPVARAELHSKADKLRTTLLPVLLRSRCPQTGAAFQESGKHRNEALARSVRAAEPRGAN
jgi:hypothetical protein